METAKDRISSKSTAYRLDLQGPTVLIEVKGLRLIHIQHSKVLQNKH